jgi:hypothetical protein
VEDQSPFSQSRPSQVPTKSITRSWSTVSGIASYLQNGLGWSFVRLNYSVDISQKCRLHRPRTQLLNLASTGHITQLTYAHSPFTYRLIQNVACASGTHLFSSPECLEGTAWPDINSLNKSTPPTFPCTAKCGISFNSRAWRHNSPPTASSPQSPIFEQ